MHVRAQVTQVEALSLRNAVERALWTVIEDVATLDLGLAARTANALFDGLHAREITNRYYRGLADVSQVTASHDLAKLAASGLLEARGAGRSAHYVGTDRLIDTVAQAIGVPAERVASGSDLAQRRNDLLAAVAERLHVSSRP